MIRFSKHEVQELPNIISQDRFSRYLDECGHDKKLALKLYCWNLELAKTLLAPLHITEITMRNAILEGIERKYGEDSLRSQGFLTSLPKNKMKFLGGRIKKYEDDEKVEEDKLVGKVVADLNLAFWQKLLESPYDVYIWESHFSAVFPHAPDESNMINNCETLCAYVEKIRKLRNRIAHHEPVFDLNLKQDLKCMKDIVSWRSKVVADWMDKIHNLDKLIAKDPRNT